MSKVEVNTIEPQCGTTVTVGKCTSTVAVPGNVVKSNALQASDGGNIVSQSGTDITLGASGDTINLASGASQSGFGRTGTVDWVTTPQTGTVTAATGKGYFVNTTSGEITVNLPAGAAGSIVGISDYASTAASNNILVEANGAELINADAGTYTISTAGLAVTLVYVDGTRGWKSVTGSEADATGVTTSYIAATGGNQPTASGCIVCTNYKVHKFTGPGTFCVSAGSGPLALADYLVVAGGAGGGDGSGNGGGGGGGGGYRESPGTASGCYSVSPLGAAPAVALPISVQGYPIVVGGGGATGPQVCGSSPGNASSFSTIPSAGGGGSGGGTVIAGKDGGSGGGAGRCNSQSGGTGNTPPVSPAQGTPGGAVGSSNAGAAGGGGATVAGGAPPTGGCQLPGGESGGPGGTGATSSIDATPTARAGGGGGSIYYNNPPQQGAAGAGGGGAGGRSGPPSAAGGVGTVNTGGGGGGGVCGGAGGSGIVIIRYKFQ